MDLMLSLLMKKKIHCSFDLKAGLYAIEGGAELDPFKYTHQLLEVATNNGLRVYVKHSSNRCKI